MKLNKEHKSTITSNIDDEKFGARREALNKRQTELGEMVYSMIYTPGLLLKMEAFPTNSFQRKSRMNVSISARNLVGGDNAMLQLLILKTTAKGWDRRISWDWQEERTDDVIRAEIKDQLGEPPTATGKQISCYVNFSEPRLVLFKHADLGQSLEEWPELWLKIYDYMTEDYQVMLESAQLRSKVKAVLEKVNTSKKFLDLWPDGRKYLPEDGEGRCSDISHADAILDIQKMMGK